MIAETVRFCEEQYYDVTRDEEVVRFMAVTNIGTWHGVAPVRSASGLRAAREGFRQFAYSAMSIGGVPCEVELG